MDLRDHHVQFRVCDIYLPDHTSVLRELHADELLCGRVVEMSDTGQMKDAFVVVEVDGLKRRLIVPIDCVEVKDNGPGIASGQAS